MCFCPTLYVPRLLGWFRLCFVGGCLCVASFSCFGFSVSLFLLASARPRAPLLVPFPLLAVSLSLLFFLGRSRVRFFGSLSLVYPFPVCVCVWATSPFRCATACFSLFARRAPAANTLGVMTADSAALLWTAGVSMRVCAPSGEGDGQAQSHPGLDWTHVHAVLWASCVDGAAGSSVGPC